MTFSAAIMSTLENNTSSGLRKRKKSFVSAEFTSKQNPAGLRALHEMREFSSTL